MSNYETSKNDSRMVTGLFRDRDSAERAYNSLADRGYSKDDVTLMMSDDTRKTHFADTDTELGSKAAEGAGIGAGIGGTIGAVLAGIAAVGTTLVLPGIGLVVAGPIAAALAGAGAGGVAGGLVGALIGAGIPEERVVHYEEGIKNGGILMGVTPRSDEDAAYVERSWTDSAGEHIIGTGVGAAGGAATGAAIGSVAGPVGTLAGAAIGGIAGGLQARAPLKSSTRNRAMTWANTTWQKASAQAPVLQPAPPSALWAARSAWRQVLPSAVLLAASPAAARPKLPIQRHRTN